MRTFAPLRLLLLLLGLLCLAQGAYAGCVTPTGLTGDIRYAGNYGVMVFCNGTNWVSMAGGVSVTVNTTGGGATPAGSSNDVQFNSSAALGADTGNFTYSASTLNVPNLNASTAITGTSVGGSTATFSGLGTFGSSLINGGLTVTGSASMTAISASTISGTLIQAGQSAASCAAAINGGIRYNSTSNTLQICVGSTWTSLSSGTANATVGGATTQFSSTITGRLTAPRT